MLSLHLIIVTDFQLLRSAAQQLINQNHYKAGLNSVNWDEGRRETLQTVLENSNQDAYCDAGEVSIIRNVEPSQTNLGCIYIL